MRARLPGRAREVSGLEQRDVSVVGKDQVIHDIDPHHRSRPDHSGRQRHVIRTWRRVPGRMVVKEHDDGRRGRRRLPEDLARMYDRGIE